MATFFAELLLESFPMHCIMIPGILWLVLTIHYIGWKSNRMSIIIKCISLKPFVWVSVSYRIFRWKIVLQKFIQFQLNEQETSYISKMISMSIILQFRTILSLLTLTKPSKFLNFLFLFCHKFKTSWSLIQNVLLILGGTWKIFVFLNRMIKIKHLILCK